jgi:hypothetical protein
MAKKATKRASKKATKRASKNPSGKATRGASTNASERAHVAGRLKSSHRAVLSVVDKVAADDLEGIARLRRAVEHAHDNAKARKGT